MSIEDSKIGDLVGTGDFVELEFGSFEWAKQPTHYPAKRPITLYGIEVGENGDMPFFASPMPYKNTLN